MQRKESYDSGHSLTLILRLKSCIFIGAGLKFRMGDVFSIAQFTSESSRMNPCPPPSSVSLCPVDLSIACSDQINKVIKIIRSCKALHNQLRSGGVVFPERTCLKNMYEDSLCLDLVSHFRGEAESWGFW
jgi:hypothetical protein